jgi:hypothetical protein
MKKIEALKVRGVQKEKEKTRFVSWKAYFPSCYFSLFLFICTSKMISKA